MIKTNPYAGIPKPLAAALAEATFLLLAMENWRNRILAWVRARGSRVGRDWRVAGSWVDAWTRGIRTAL